MSQICLYCRSTLDIHFLFSPDMLIYYMLIYICCFQCIHSWRGSNSKIQITLFHRVSDLPLAVMQIKVIRLVRQPQQVALCVLFRKWQKCDELCIVFLVYRIHFLYLTFYASLLSEGVPGAQSFRLTVKKRCTTGTTDLYL